MALTNPAADVNNPGDRRELLLTMGAEIVARYRERYAFEGMTFTKMIGTGRNWQFPLFGRSVADYHSPGDDVVGTPINSGEKIVNLDGFKLASVEVADIDDLITHFDFRREYVAELADAIAAHTEERVIRTIVNGANSSALVDGRPDGSQIALGAASFNAVTAEQLLTALAQAASNFDNNNIPEDKRYMALAPQDHRLLVADTTALNKDWGGMGSYAGGTLPEVQGIKLVKSVRLAAIRGNDFNTLEPEERNQDYIANLTNTVAVAWCPNAVATVQRVSPEMSIYETERFTDSVRVRELTGHGHLRPECLQEITL